jgi:putative transcriptional regulator
MTALADRDLLFLRSANAQSDEENRLKVLRAERDWTQADLADRCRRSSRQTIVALENEKYSPSLELAYKFSRILEDG